MNPTTLPEHIEVLLDRYNSDECTDDERIELEVNLSELMSDRDDLLRSMLLKHADLTMEIEGADAMAKKYKERHSRLLMQQDRLEQFANSIMRRSGMKEFKSDIGKINYRKSTAVVLDPAFVVIEEWGRVKPMEADKTKIKELLQAGREVPGARIEERMNIQFK